MLCDILGKCREWKAVKLKKDYLKKLKLKRNKKIIEINDCYVLYNYYDCEMFIMNMINSLNKIKNVYDKEKEKRRFKK